MTNLLGDHALDLFIGLPLVLELGHHDGELLASLLYDQRLRDIKGARLQQRTLQRPEKSTTQQTRNEKPPTKGATHRKRSFIA